MSDSEIINLYLERSEDAIRETDAKYGKLCRYIAMKILFSNEDSEECVNDTYLCVWNVIYDGIYASPNVEKLLTVSTFGEYFSHYTVAELKIKHEKC